MLMLLARSMFEATRITPLANTSVGQDWRTAALLDRGRTDATERSKRMESNDIDNLVTRTGTVERVWQLEIQATPEDVEKIIDSVMAVDPLIYGRYQRNAFVSAVGSETYLPEESSTSAVHLDAAGKVQTFSSVLIVISVPQDRATLAGVLDAVRDVHHYEEPLIFIKDCWASRARYDPHNDNPNRWWNRAKAGEGA